MKLTATSFTSLRHAFQNQSLDKISCFIDNIEVPIRECGGIEELANLEVSTLNFWEAECDGHPTSSHCKVYDI